MSQRKRHTAKQIVKKLRDAMIVAGKSIGEVSQTLAVSEAHFLVGVRNMEACSPRDRD